MNDIDKLIERGAELARKHEEMRDEILNNPDVSQELKDKFIQLEEEFKKKSIESKIKIKKNEKNSRLVD